MRTKKFRDLAFIMHRYVGLAVGLIVVLIGLTGSLLVFDQEIEHFLVAQSFGHVVPQPQRISTDAILEIIKSEVAKQSDLRIGSIVVPKDATSPYQARLWDSTDKLTQMFINPYTGKVMGFIKQDSSWMRFAFHLHYELLAGKPGQIIAGITGLLLFILNVTGILLWPGWRRLIAGFKIKWQAHPKRVNFDIHKVTGIFVAMFLAVTGFTGFCWNFYDYSVPVIYAATFTTQPPELTSKPIPGRSPLSLSQILQTAETAIPNAQTTYIGIPDKPEKVIRIGKRQVHETSHYGESEVYIDQYSGQVLRVSDSRNLALGDRFLNSFAPLHFGTFWGLTSRIIYVFVGLAPLILSITGVVMWWYRRRIDTTTPNAQLQGNNFRR